MRQHHLVFLLIVAAAFYIVGARYPALAQKVGAAS
jgi:hypothetical protein